MTTSRSMVLVFVLGAAACGSGDGASDGNPGDTDAPPCAGIACFQVECTGGAITSVSGTVHAPNGTLPLYNATVYVPTTTVPPFEQVLSCDQCGDALPGNPLVQTTTDTQGQFVLTDVPVTNAVPLVIQIGRWRRQVTVDVTTECVDTPLSADDIRLPSTQLEGEIPRIALSTGDADALECLLRKIGIADTEFTNPGGGGRIALFDGEDGASTYSSGLGGDDFPQSEDDLWATTEDLSEYDVVVLSCEGAQNLGTKPESARLALQTYADLGGRVFASHWHNAWIQNGPPPWDAVGNWVNHPDADETFDADIDTSFTRGADLATWLVNVGASTTLGQVPLVEAKHTLNAVNPVLAQRWLYKDDVGGPDPSVQYFQYTTPLGEPAADQCGRVVFSDIHVSGGDSSNDGTPFPDGCDTVGLTPQEKVLAFMLFDISSCIDVPID